MAQKGLKSAFVGHKVAWFDPARGAHARDLLQHVKFTQDYGQEG